MSATKFFGAHLRTTHFSPMNQPLAETLFWIAVLACAVAELAILRFTFAARRANKSELVPASARSGELAWAIIPALALCAVLVATWQRIEARESHMQMMDHSGMQHSMPMPSPQSAAPPT
jgi:heme/copper-type cytochrome/quinol oxidase subunit 2